MIEDRFTDRHYPGEDDSTGLYSLFPIPTSGGSSPLGIARTGLGLPPIILDQRPDDEDAGEPLGTGRATVAVILGAMASVLAAVAIVISIVAVTGSPGAETALPSGTPAAPELAAPVAAPLAAGGPLVSVGPPATVAAIIPPLDAVPTVAGQINPNATFTRTYPLQTLRVQPPDCDTAMTRYVDLDEPRVNAGAVQADLYYEPKIGCAGSVQLGLIDGVAAAVAASPKATPADCVRQLRNAPVDGPISIPVGTTLCLLTSPSAAFDQGIMQKLVVLTVTGLTGDDIATMTATAWDVLP